MSNLFYLLVQLKPYKDNPEYFRGLIRQLKENGLDVIDAEETPIVDAKTKDVVYEGLSILIREIIPGAKKDLVKSLESTKDNGGIPQEFKYNGLPMYM